MKEEKEGDAGEVVKCEGYRADALDMRVVQFSQDGAGGFAEHRRSWREAVVASGVLTADGVSGAAGQRVVRIVNFSKGGVGIVSPAGLSLGSEYALVVAGRPERSGRVRVVFCQPIRGGFDVGAEYIADNQVPRT